MHEQREILTCTESVCSSRRLLISPAGALKETISDSNQPDVSLNPSVLCSFEVSFKRYYYIDMRLRVFSAAGVCSELGASRRILINSIDDVIIDILLTVRMGIRVRIRKGTDRDVACDYCVSFRATAWHYWCISLLFADVASRQRQTDCVWESTWTLWGVENTVWDSIDAQLSPNKKLLIGNDRGFKKLFNVFLKPNAWKELKFMR